MTRPLVPRVPKPWRPRPVLPLLTLAVLALGIAASAGAGLRSTHRGPDALRAPVASASHAVQISNFAFAPQSLSIAAGDSITWTNQDEAPHTVTTTSGPQSISSPMLSKGQSFTFTFTVAGTYSYYCAVHPDMRAQVVVNPAPAAPTTPSHSPKPSTSAPPPPTHSAVVLPTHPSGPASTDSGHEQPVSSAPAARSGSSGASGAAAPSTQPASSAASTAATTPSAVPASAPASTDAAAAPSVASSSQDSLNPTLLLAGVTAGATVFCLLLAASRRSDGS